MFSNFPKVIAVAASALLMFSFSDAPAAKDKRNALEKAEVVYEGTYEWVVVTPPPKTRDEGVIGGLLNSAINSKTEKSTKKAKLTMTYDGRIVKMSWGKHVWSGTFRPKRKRGDCKLVTTTYVIKTFEGKCDRDDLTLSGKGKGRGGKTYKVKMELVATGYTDLLEQERRRAELEAECNDPDGSFVACTELEELKSRANPSTSNSSASVAAQNRSKIPNNNVRPRTSPSRWVTETDYKTSWRGRGYKGQVEFTTSVNEKGRVTSCKVVRSSGFPILDSKTCELVTRRARFWPATDSNGAATQGVYSNTVTWSMP